jgi:hypothetical protein
MENKLDWLCKHLHSWHFFSDAIATVYDNQVVWLDPNKHDISEGITQSEWLLRKEQLGL